MINLKLMGAFAVIAVLGFGLHKISIWTLNTKHKLELTAQAEALNTRCEKEKNITKEVSRDYQSKLGSLKSQLNNLKRVQSRCIVPETIPPRGYDGTSSTRELSGSNGISTDWLFNYAGNAEETRLKLLACQDFINRTMEN